MKRFILSTVVLFGTLLFAFFLEGGRLLDFVLPSPLIIVVGVTAFAVLAVWSLKDWGRAWKDAFAKEAGSPSAGTSAALWAFYEKACYAAGVVGFLLGINIIGSNSGAIDRLGASIAVNCIAPILSVLFALVARILRARVEQARG
jgi:flagellar motor component MotA